MDEAPRDVADPVSGQRWVFLRTGAETDGELLEAELHVSPGGFVRAHVHPAQVETFAGVEGTLFLDVAGRTHAVGPGESVFVPPGTPHALKPAPGPSRVRVTVQPALALDDYFRAYLGLSRDGRVRLPVRGLPGGILQLALLMDRFSAEIAAAELPPGVQRPAWRALAAAGRLRGLSASFPEYGAP